MPHVSIPREQAKSAKQQTEAVEAGKGHKTTKITCIARTEQETQVAERMSWGQGQPCPTSLVWRQAVREAHHLLRTDCTRNIKKRVVS